MYIHPLSDVKSKNIGKDSKIWQFCVVFEKAVIGENCNINYVISDKDVIIKEDRTLMGFQSYPVYISKASMV